MVRARSAAEPWGRERPDSPNAWRQLSHERVEFGFGPLAPDEVVGSVGVFDVFLEIPDPLLVSATRRIVEHRSAVATDVDAAGEFEAVHLLVRSSEEHRQVAQPFARRAVAE